MQGGSQGSPRAAPHVLRARADGHYWPMGSPRVIIADHPVVAHRIATLRSARTDAPTFRRVLGETAALVAYEALRDLATAIELVDTPVAAAAPCTVVDETVLLVPVLRAGLGMVPAIQAILPRSEVAHVGLRRDEATLEPTVYLDALPKRLEGRRVVVCDPMLATGGSLARVCDMLAARGATDVTALCLLASGPGLARVHARHPALTVACAAIDAELDGSGYIVPGLGDAGDRLFGPPS